MMQGLSIIIVNYKSLNLIIDCLNSFTSKIIIENWEIIIVDNFSKDDSEKKLKKLYPFIKYLQMGYNAGFARANNTGMLASTYNTFLLLNADTIVKNGSISDCYKSLINSKHVACGVQLLNYDHSYQISGSYAVKGGLNYLLLLPFLRTMFTSIAKLIKLNKPSIEKADQVQEVDWINGAFLMVKQDAVMKAGLMDEDFFLYMEEIEWCSRLRKQGKICIYGNLNIIHLQGVTTKEHFQSKNKGYQNLSDKMGRQMMLSIWVRQRKEFGSAWLLLLFTAYGVEIPIFLLGLCISKLLLIKKYSWSDFTGFTKNYFLNTRFLIPIIRNKPCFYKVV